MRVIPLLLFVCIATFSAPQMAAAQHWACKGKTGCEAPGSACPDGTIFAGCPAPGYQPMYTTRCDGGRFWSGTDCTGTMGWTFLGAGDEGTCGVKLDGSGYCWGSDATLQVGNGATTGNQLVPAALSGGGTWLSVNAGFESACGLKTDGTAWCWGEGQNGVIGNGATTDQNAPTAVGGGHTFKMIAMNNSATHACGIRASDDALYCWGYNNEGGLGDNTNTNRSSPTGVNGGGAWKYIATGYGNSCGIKTDDSLWCWGRNVFGAVGDNTQVDKWVPTAVNGGGTWKRVSIGYEHACGIKSDDTGWCWGYRANGEIGDGTYGARVLVPTAVSGGYKWKEISVGTWSSCGIRTDGVLMCWGDNSRGQLGNNTTNTSNVPVAVSGGDTWRTISLGWLTACGIKTDDRGYCWGYNDPGTVGDNTSGTNRLVPTAISGSAGARITVPFNNGNATGGTDVVGASSLDNGIPNTAALVVADSDSGVGGTQPHQAAAYCDGLTIHGYSDWYLPAAYEAFLLRLTLPNDFDIYGSSYWASTNGAPGYAWHAVGGHLMYYPDDKDTSLYVRCTRRQ